MENPSVSRVSVALGDTEINIVTQTSNERALYNFSLALRQIIREWSKQQTSKQMALPEPGARPCEEK